MELEELWQPTPHEVDAQEFILELESVRLDHHEVYITSKIGDNFAQRIADYYKENYHPEKTEYWSHEADEIDRELARETLVYVDLNGDEYTKIKQAYADISELAKKHHGINRAEETTHPEFIEKAKRLLEPEINPFEDTPGLLRLRVGFCFRRNTT